VSAALETEGWRLEPAREQDIDELMEWFDGEHSVKIWGGPKFRYPFNRETFLVDSHWGDMATFCLRDSCDRFRAFGQLYERDRRINLARLITHPEVRRQGVGKRLVQMLMSTGADLFALDEYSLFVFRDNTPALGCYRSLGFEIQNYPSHEVLADECYYLTRPVVNQKNRTSSATKGNET